MFSPLNVFGYDGEPVFSRLSPRTPGRASVVHPVVNVLCRSLRVTLRVLRLATHVSPVQTTPIHGERDAIHPLPTSSPPSPSNSTPTNVPLKIELCPPLESISETEAVCENIGSLSEDVEEVGADAKEGEDEGKEGGDSEDADPGGVDTSQDQERDIL